VGFLDSVGIFAQAIVYLVEKFALLLRFFALADRREAVEEITPEAVDLTVSQLQAIFEL